MEMRLKIAALSIMAMISSGIYGFRIDIYNYTEDAIDGTLLVGTRSRNSKHSADEQFEIAGAKPDKNGAIGSKQAKGRRIKKSFLVVDGISVNVKNPHGVVTLAYSLPEPKDETAWFEVRKSPFGKYQLTYSKSAKKNRVVAEKAFEQE